MAWRRIDGGGKIVQASAVSMGIGGGERQRKTRKPNGIVAVIGAMAKSWRRSSGGGNHLGVAAAAWRERRRRRVMAAPGSSAKGQKRRR
jgi:hypothetical protein